MLFALVLLLLYTLISALIALMPVRTLRLLIISLKINLISRDILYLTRAAFILVLYLLKVILI